MRPLVTGGPGRVAARRAASDSASPTAASTNPSLPIGIAGVYLVAAALLYKGLAFNSCRDPGKRITRAHSTTRVNNIFYEFLHPYRCVYKQKVQRVCRELTK